MKLEQCKQTFGGKRITMLGLGLLGRGVGDAEFLARCDAKVLVTDKRSEVELSESVAKLKRFRNISFQLGGHRIGHFTGCDMVVKAAGVAHDSPEIAAAHEAGVPIYMSTALFAKFAIEAGAIIVGITGTRGKSTIAHMIFHALQKAGLPGQGKRALLGGNIRGMSTLAMLPEVKRGDVAILELDSWQLQGFGDLQISPHIAVFANFMPDHMSYYRGNMDTYFADKANIFRFQGSDDVLIVGASVAGRIRGATPPLDPIVPAPIPRSWKLRILGEHNRENASLAAATLEALDVADMRDSIESFEGVEGRLQFVRELGGVKIYNDNNSTTPEATIAALNALRDSSGQNRNIVLIMGGADKGLNMSVLTNEVQKTCKAVILLAGTGTEKLKIENRKSKIFGFYNALAPALTKALESCDSGDVVLFSPAFASFGIFKNEYDRNDQFLSLVRSL